LPSEAIRPKMAGIGIRYFELVRRLPRPGLEVVLIHTGDPTEVPEELSGTVVRRFERGRLRELVADCDVAISQGQLANDLLLEVPELPTVIDLYDPFLVENMTYVETLGLDPYRNDHATWVLQLSRGDFFLCSSEEQRQFYLGFLAALGRLNPRRVANDPDLEALLGIVPFGAPEELPAAQLLLPARRPGERRLLFGGLYDWYDPWPVLRALEMVDEPLWTLLFIRNPNPEATPQKLLREVETWCVERGFWNERVQMLDWIPAARRFDLLREVDLLVATHAPTIETRLSLRTRFLEALAADCPVITSAGGAMSRLLSFHGAGQVVPTGDAAAVAEALRRVLGEGTEERALRQQGQKELLKEFRWSSVLEPLVRFCECPEKDPTKDEFAFRPSTMAPQDSLLFRLRRRLRGLRGGRR
jgi:glycosyltransferase involved in cell wall biosynthesis